MSQQHNSCYGKMFPDILHDSGDGPHRGKVFSFEFQSAGGLCRTDRETATNMDVWDDCVRCPEFDACYKLSMAQLALQSAIAHA